MNSWFDPSGKLIMNPAGNRTFEQVDEMATSASHNELSQLISHSGGGSVRFKGTVSEFADVAVGTNAAAYTRGSNFTFDASVTLAAGTSTVQVVATDMGSNTVTNEYELPLTAGDEADFYYDLNGNLTSIHQQASSIVFEWDALDRLISWSEGTNRAEFVYDGQDRRVVIRDISGSVTNERQLLWCGSRICQERDKNGAVSKHFFSEGFELLSGTNAGVYFYGQDHLGSVRELIDTTGTIQTQYDYDPWGRRTKESGGVEADFGYTLHYYHQLSELVLAKHRAFLPELGRWLNRDSIGERGPDGPMLYGFVRNDPINLRDPHGLSASSVIGSMPPPGWGDFAPGYSLRCIAAIGVTDVITTKFFREGDLFRLQHCITSCKIRKACGSGIYNDLAGWFKEWFDSRKPSPPFKDETADPIDIAANRSGQQCAKERSCNRKPKSCEQCCKEKGWTN